MDTMSYLAAMLYPAMCGYFASLSFRMSAIHDRPGRGAWRTLFGGEGLLAVAYIAMQLQFAVSDFPIWPAVISTTIAVYLGKKTTLNDKTRWPLLGLLLVPFMFHVAPHLGIDLY